MATAGSKGAITRLHIAAIHVQLKKRQKYPIYVGLFVDGSEVHQLSPIAENLPLLWSVDLPIEVLSQSEVTVQVKEAHRVRVWRGDLGSCMLSSHPDWLNYDPSGAQKEILLHVEKFTISVKFSPPLGFVDTKDLTQRAIAATNDVGDSILGNLGQARSAVETIMSVLEQVEGVHPIATAALGTLTKAFKFLEEEERYDETMQDIALGMANMLSFAEAANQHAKIVQLKEIIAQMLLMVEDASRYILEYQSSGKFGRTVIALVSSERRVRVDGLIKRFDILRAGFDRGVAIQVLDTSSNILQVVVATEDRLLLDKLPQAHSARYDPNRSCMEGTRMKILEDIIGWSSNSNGSTSFLWVQGPAGVGKSSIASSAARELEKTRRLGATFFCNRDKPELRDPAYILPTIAAQLAITFPPFGKAIADQLRQDPGIGGSATQFQYEGLFASPINQIVESDLSAQSTPIVIVIDALDECGNTETRKILLKYLLQISSLADWLKVIATSRPEADITRVLKPSSLCTSFSLRLDDDATFDDILLFTQTRMSEIVEADGIDPADWPGTVRTKELAERAGGLFIWAQTASLFIANGQDPEQCLQLLLSRRSPPGSYAKLDALYTTALVGTFGESDDYSIETFRSVVGTIVAAFTPLPAQAIHDFLQGRISMVAIRKVIRNLGSVLYEDEQNDSVVRVCHTSFIDFITDNSRCGSRFFIDLVQHHTTLALASLQIMQDQLTFNICNLESSDLFNDQVPGLAERVRTAISIPLRYSCVHWMSHLHEACMDAPLLGLVDQFLNRETVLFWIEALSLLGEVPAAIHGLPLVVPWFDDHDHTSSLFITDIHRFVLAFKEPIIRSTPHLYVSALPFAPTESLVSKRFLSSFPNTVSLNDREPFWSLCLQALEGHSATVRSVSWSQDGLRIVSGSDDKTICIWDSTTGAMMQQLRGHTNCISSVSFSPNGKLIASGSWDTTVQIWDAETGVPMFPQIPRHTEMARCVIFSPNGKYLASCSHDKTICIWNVTTGESVLSPFKGHSSYVLCIAYSPDGARIVSGSHDTTLRVWNVETGHTTLGPLTFHTGEISAVDFSSDGKRILSSARSGIIIICESTTGLVLHSLPECISPILCAKFSPDGRLILSAPLDSTTQIWDAESGLQLSTQEHLTSVRSVNFSPNGQRFVTGCYDRTVRIWGLDCNRPSPPLVSDSGHTDIVNSVALSPDGKYIASGSRDKTVRVWDASNGLPASGPLHGHSEGVMAVAFSPDGHSILSASYDATLRLWLVATWESKSKPFSGHADAIMCAKFFPDGQRIISGSRDHTIRLWDPATGKEVCEPLQGHRGALIGLDISSNGRYIASSSEDWTVKIWDSVTYDKLFDFPHPRGDTLSIAFSPDHRHVASYTGNWARLWDAPKQIVIWQTPLSPSAIGDCIFSQNGERLICSSSSLIYILNASTGSILHSPFKGHGASIPSLAISADSKCLISGSDDNSIRAWDIEFDDKERGQELISSMQKLPRPVSNDGWTEQKTTADPLLWIPTEYRDGLWIRLLFSIPPTAQNHPRALDCSRFRHGTAWTEVRCT